MNEDSDWQEWLENERESVLRSHLATLQYLISEPPPDDPALVAEYQQFCSDVDDIVLELHRRDMENAESAA